MCSPWAQCLRCHLPSHQPSHAAGIGHIINNAYGVQSATLCRLITSAWRRGRVDAVVQSTDKNFMVPVGGAVVSACRSSPALVEAVNKAYPGR